MFNLKELKGDKRKMKRLSLVIVLLALVAFTGLVSAQPAQIQNVMVNDVSAVAWDGAAFVTQTIHVERGQDAVVEIYFTGEDDGLDTNGDGVIDLNDIAVYDGVRVEANLGGYEHGKIESYTREAFEVREGNSYKRVLRLSIPEDLDASEDYELEVRIWNKDLEDEVAVPLRIEETRHLLNVYDVIISPTAVEAGQKVFVSVLVENIGAKKEDRASVTVSIPELGVEAKEFLTELQIVDADDDDDDDNEEVVDVSLDIPECADAGEYDVVVRLDYNRGHTESEDTYTVTVNSEGVCGGQTPAVVPTETFIANVDKASQSVTQGQGVVYTLSLANLADSAKIYTFAVEGAEWASVRVDPQSVTLNKDETKAVLVYVSPAENAAVGASAFTVKVLEGANVAKEFSLTANVVASESTGYNTFKKVLEIGFIVLLIILVILGIVVVAKKLAGNDDEDDGIEGQTYY